MILKNIKTKKNAHTCILEREEKKTLRACARSIFPLPASPQKFPPKLQIPSAPRISPPKKHARNPIQPTTILSIQSIPALVPILGTRSVPNSGQRRRSLLGSDGEAAEDQGRAGASSRLLDR